MTESLPARVHSRAIDATEHRTAATPTPTPVAGGSPRAPIVLSSRPAPVIRRLLDKTTMNVMYGCASDTVIGSVGLNALFEKEHAAIGPMIDHWSGAKPAKFRQGWVNTLARFLTAKGEPQIDSRWALLAEINTHFTERVLSVQKGDDHVSTAELTSWRDTARGRKPDDERFKFVRNQSVLQWANIAPTVTGTTPIAAPLMTDITTHGQPDNPALILGKTQASLAGCHALYPPGAPLARAGLAWGAGAKDSIAANEDVHARKHLIPLGKTLSPDEHEHYKWMKHIGYQVTRVEVEAILAKPIPEPQAVKMFNAGGIVETQDQAHEFFRVFLPVNAGVATALLGKHQASYLAAVLVAAGSMTDLTVTATGDSVLMVGQSGDIFIACRWDGAKFGVSSGYFNPKSDRWDANQKDKLWSLTPA